LKAGDIVTYSYTIQNTSKVPMDNV